MKIKTYVVRTLTDAVERIKRDLGPEAVILSTRKATSSGQWWKPGTSRLEVTAAIDAEGFKTEKPSSGQSTVLGQTMRLVNQVTEERMSPLRDELVQIKDSLNRLVPNEPGKISNDVSKTEDLDVRTALDSPRQLDQENDLEKAPLVENDFQDNSQVSPDMFKSSSMVNLQNGGKAITQICNQLLWHHLSPTLVQELADYLIKVRTDQQSTREVQNKTVKWLLDKIPDIQTYDLDKSHQRLVALVGPTGSGKTTTLAKLASHFSLDQNKSIAFVTLDHFRVGAEEQLRKYAHILRIPCAVCVNKQQFKRALTRFSDVDIVLIDTAGTSPKDTEGVIKLANTLNVGESIWKAIVVPATLRDPDLKLTMDQFGVTNFDKIIVTKLDETSCFGSLFNASYRSSLPLSYFTMGQMVPEDLELATKERVVDCLLNLSGMYPHIEEYADQMQNLLNFSMMPQEGRHS